jgi:hypothetical protein
MHERPQSEMLPGATEGLSEARRNFVGFLNDRITAPITLFQNHALTQQSTLDTATQLPLDLRPSLVDPKTGGFTTEAVADFHAAVNSVINSAHQEGVDKIKAAYVRAHFAVKNLFDNESERNRIIFFEMQSRWEDDPSISPHITHRIYSSRS